MLLEKCPYCGSTLFEKFKPEKGNVMFISSADTETKQIFSDSGFICDLFVCNNCGNIHLKMKQ